MNSADCSFDVQDGYNGDWVGFSGSQHPYTGHHGTYVSICTINTGGFDGVSGYLHVSLGCVLGWPSANSTYYFHWALCTAYDNRDSYVGTTGDVGDAYQIASGTSSFSGLTASVTPHYLDIGSPYIKPYTTYYLILWANSDDGNNCMQVWTPSNHSGTLYYYPPTRLYVSSGAHSSITVNRTSSPYEGAGTGYLGGGTALYYGDVLQVTFGVEAGYSFTTQTVNGSTFSNGGSATVTDGDMSVVSAAVVNSYTLSISQSHAAAAVNRTSSPNGGGATGTLASGAVLYYGDVLAVSFAADVGYAITAHTVNGSAFTSGSSTTIASNIAVVVSAAVAIFLLTLDNQSADSSGSSAIYEKYSTGYYQESACTNQMTASANPITKPARSGYVFGGYFTAAGGSGEQILSADGYLLDGVDAALFVSAVALYAYWIRAAIFRIKVAGGWKTHKHAWIKVNGVWKKVVRIYVKADNAWRQSI